MHRLAWILGAIGLPLSHYWLIAKVEPFYSSIYIFLWWSYIFVADFLVYKLRGTSLFSDRPWEFLVIWFWSVPAWIIFEIVNRRIENWYYVMAPVSLFVGVLYLLFAFGAVLPGIFVTVELIVGLVEKFVPGGKITGPPFVAHRQNLAIQMLVGAGMLVFLLIFPKSCYAFAWGFVFFLLDPICYWRRRNQPNHVGVSLLGQMAAGDNTRFVAILLGGMICGGLWEAWNLGARTKWIYSVPFFDELKLGEMPIIGFLGFPPFALECYAMVNLLSYYRGGRNWELSGAQNRPLRGMSRRAMVASAFLLVVILGLGGLSTLYTVASFAEPINWHFGADLKTSGVEALRARHALQGNEFLKLKERPPEISPQLWNRLQRVVRMSELKGMGLEKALLLEKLDITTFDQLAKQNPSALAAKLQQLGARARAEETKVWIRAARQIG